MGTRRYVSPSRQADAARTRAHILDAVGELCSTIGYQATTLKAIAERAGVSVQSVSLAGSKASLLVGAYERAFSGTEGAESLAARPAMIAIMAEPDASAAIDRWLWYVAEANERTAALYPALVTAAQLDPLARVALANLNSRRAADMQLATTWCIERGLLDARHDDHVADKLGLIVGPEAYGYLITDRGWNPSTYHSWMREALPFNID